MPEEQNPVLAMLQLGFSWKQSCHSGVLPLHQVKEPGRETSAGRLPIHSQSAGGGGGEQEAQPPVCGLMNFLPECLNILYCTASCGMSYNLF